MERVESRLGTFGLEKSWNQLSRNPSHLRAAPALQIHCCTRCNCTVHIAHCNCTLQLHTLHLHIAHCTLHITHCNCTFTLHIAQCNCTLQLHTAIAPQQQQLNDLAKSCSCCTFQNQSSLLCRCSFAATNGHLDSHFAAAHP